MNKFNKGDAREILIKHSISPSYHRISVLKYMLNNRTHPTVEMIYKELIDEIPTLSKTTVYNSLNLFEQKHIVSPLNIEPDTLRYDINTDPHMHFICRECGEIYDIYLDIKDYIADMKELEGYNVDQCDIVLHGVCKKCRDKEKKTY